jgi:hypothetical protein
MADRVDIDSYVEVAAQIVGLQLDPAFRPGVALNFARIADMAALFMEFPLPDETEPAPVFEP